MAWKLSVVPLFLEDGKTSQPKLPRPRHSSKPAIDAGFLFVVTSEYDGAS
jgi:hypothetical protein